MNTYKLTYTNHLDPSGSSFTIKRGNTSKQAQGYAEAKLGRKIEVIKTEEI